MIGIIDYGMGNLMSVKNAFDSMKIPAELVSTPEEILNTDALILPGVGAFGDGMKNLRERNLVDPMREMVFDQNKLFLGICLGMQLIAKTGYEFGEHEGLGWIDATVEKIETGDPLLKVPHMGWNELDLRKPCALYEGMDEHPVYYFVHSFMVCAQEDVITATCSHGAEIPASLQKGNIYATQFHPEKSQRDGLKLLENFSGLLTSC